MKTLKQIIEQETLCKDWKRKVDYCKAYKEPYCPLTCTYAKKMLTTKDYMEGMDIGIINSNIQKRR